MFISYQYIRSLDNPIPGGHSLYEYKIVDSDFEEIVIQGTRLIGTDLITAVIDVYSKRNLDVARNLVLLIQLLLYNENYVHTLANAKSLPCYQKYAADVDALMVWM